MGCYSWGAQPWGHCSGGTPPPEPTSCRFAALSRGHADVFARVAKAAWGIAPAVDVAPVAQVADTALAADMVPAVQPPTLLRRRSAW